MTISSGTQSSVLTSYTPAMPLQTSSTSIMSQDVITTDLIPVSSISLNPVAAFINTGNGQLPEALVVATLSEAEGASPQLCHVTRNAQTNGGWSLVPLFDGRTANEVAAGTTYADSSAAAAFGFFNDDSGLYYTQLQSDGVTWSSPQSLLQGATANLKAAYSPAGRLILYGSTPQGDLVTGYQEQMGGPFVSTICAMGAGLVQGDFKLCMTDEKSWTVVSNVSGQPTVYTGLIGATEYSSIDQVSQFPGTLKQVVLGYWNDTQNTLMFLLVDSDNALHVWATNALNATTVIQPIPNSTVASATGHVSTDQTLHVYSIDNAMNLWVLHQNKDNPWNDDGSPNWSPFIPLDQQIAAVACDSTPADAPSLFACAAADYSLRLHAQDSLTGMWRSGPVLQDSEAAFEVVRFRTEVTLFDANGVPLSNYPVSISVAEGYSGAEICVARNNYAVDSQSSVSLTTDNAGKVTIATLTSAGMVTPNLMLNAEGLSAALTLQPAAPIHSYLAGQGQLNLTNPSGPLPVFDKLGNTLTGATVNGVALAPAAQGNSALAGAAAQAIQNTALVGIGQPPTGIAGYSFSISGPHGPTFSLHQTPAEVEAQLSRLVASSDGGMGSIWSDIEQWAGDAWEGIKNGVIQITGFVVDVANQVATFTAQVGNMIAKGVQLALKGLEQAAHFIAGVFQAIGAELAKLIDWLKALFDFAAIWRTKEVFENGLLALPTYLAQLFAAGQADADNWFSQKEQDVSNAFDQLKATFAGQSFQNLPNWQPMGQPPSNQTTVAGNATPADFSNNVHHNWLQDKVSSGAPPDFGLSPDNSLEAVWNSAVPKIISAGQDFMNAFTDFKKAITNTIKDPPSFGSFGIPDFLDAVKNLINAVLKLCDAVLDLFLGMAQLTMTSIDTLLGTELQLGYLNTLWQWIADQAGQSSDNKLTVASVLALMAAFPATVVYKLIEGVGAEPFPDGVPPWSSAGLPVARALGDMPKSCLTLAAVLQIFYAVPAIISDGLGPACPLQISLFMLGLGGLIWILTNGLPDIAMLTAGIAAASIVVTAALIVWGTIPKVLLAIKSLIPVQPSDAFIILFALYGVGRLGLLAMSDVTDANQFLAQVLLPLPYIIGCLNLSMFRDDILAPLFLACVFIFDAAGFMGAGIAELVDASSGTYQIATA